VQQSVVMGREAGPGDLRLVAYIVFKPGEDLTASDVRRHLRCHLPDYMIPSVVAAVDTIPLTPNGKVDRAALPDPFRNAVQVGRHHVAPEPGPEQTMAEIWREILRVDTVGAEDNFFELGGHSLLSLRVVVAVEKRLGWRMDARTLFFQNLRQVVVSAAAGKGVVKT
jgi:acyl carrier protein